MKTRKILNSKLKTAAEAGKSFVEVVIDSDKISGNTKAIAAEYGRTEREVSIRESGGKTTFSFSDIRDII